jgi:hypothetical protein
MTSPEPSRAQWVSRSRKYRAWKSRRRRARHSTNDARTAALSRCRQLAVRRTGAGGVAAGGAARGSRCRRPGDRRWPSRVARRSPVRCDGAATPAVTRRESAASCHSPIGHPGGKPHGSPPRQHPGEALPHWPLFSCPRLAPVLGVHRGGSRRKRLLTATRPIKVRGPAVLRDASHARPQALRSLRLGLQGRRARPAD